MKPKIFLPFLLSLLIFNSSLLISTVRYVSPTGSSTPPYTSWETAADSIMECINISVFGDTIYVANGTYREQVVMIPGLSLIGAGMDSCVIDTKELAYDGLRTIEILDSCTIKGFKIFVGPITGQRLGTAVFMKDSTIDCLIESNYMLSAYFGVWATDGKIKSNIISNVNIGTELAGSNNFAGMFTVFIDSNFISFSNDGISSINYFTSQEVYARGNVFFLANPYTTFSPVFENNLSSTFTPEFSNNTARSIVDSVQYEKGIVNTLQGNFTNNVFLSKFENAFYTTPAASIKNNIVVGSANGVTSSNGIDVRFNDFWQVQNKYSGFTINDDTTNLEVDPMFVNQDSLDLHLQMYSPLIDAGDPTILDKDGSRSDIGIWGGPYGEKYTYRDLAPKPPSNLTAIMDSGLVKLSWNKNTEADFNVYRVYRDTVPDFMYDTTKIIAVLADTIYFDDLPEKYLAGDYYYKITALDNTAHQSATSEEVHVNITGIPEAPPVVIDHYQLLNNYPNPFNPSTKIPYRLIKPGYVKLYVYDIKGEVVKLLVNGYQNSGYYEVEFNPNQAERERSKLGGEGFATGYNDDIATGIYIYQIMVRGEGDIPVFSDMGKMILLK